MGTEYGDTVITSASDPYAIVDTSTSFLLMAPADYNMFTLQIQTVVNGTFDCTGKNCFSLEPCGYFVDQLKNITLKIDSAYYSIAPSGYMDDAQGTC